ncbi:hypothetical protein OI70_18920 [Dickeya fangzhongdai]|nr:hypothetical protein OI70_18920 [Dickeya fangzhongdai]
MQGERPQMQMGSRQWQRIEIDGVMIRVITEPVAAALEHMAQAIANSDMSILWQGNLDNLQQ